MKYKIENKQIKKDNFCKILLLNKKIKIFTKSNKGKYRIKFLSKIKNFKIIFVFSQLN